MTIPKIVAQPMTADELGWSFFDSTESCVVDAVSSALLIWAAVKGWVPWTSQSVVVVWMWNSRHRVLGDHGVGCGSPRRQRSDLLDNRVREAARGRVHQRLPPSGPCVPTIRS